MAGWINPFWKYGVRLPDFDKLPEVNDGCNDAMMEIVEAWKSNAPARTGAYRESIDVVEPSVSSGRGVVGATSDNAHFVEFGASHTPEYAPAEKTAKQFGGYAHGKPGT
ncbi:HK97 gp10 family phage protein [Mycolicibacillus trivialis]